MTRLATAAQIEEHRDGFRELLNGVQGDSGKGDVKDGAGFFSEADTHVFARVRPVLPNEEACQHFRTVFASDPRTMSVHMLSTTLKGLPKLSESKFKVDHAFGAMDGNEEIYEAICSPLVRLAKSGGTATLFAYGQTGSGKTYTVAGLVGLAATDLFIGSTTLKLYVSVIEILGGNVTDLLSGADDHQVQILEDRFGTVQFSGCSKIPITDESELLTYLEQAIQSRRTEATKMNDASSRSHMIIRIAIENIALPEAEDGILCLVDLAGSESASDTSKHGPERMKETRLINSSLMTLKNCMRGRSLVLSQAGHVHIPYRDSKLTLALRDCFELAVRRPVKSAIIACVSPLETACYHSSNSLRYAADIRVAPRQVVLEIDDKDPYNWDRPKCIQFLERASKGLAVVSDILPEGSGKTLVKMPEHEFLQRALASQTMTDKQAKELYIKVWKMVINARTRFRTKQRDVTAKPDRWAEELLERLKEEAGN